MTDPGPPGRRVPPEPSAGPPGAASLPGPGAPDPLPARAAPSLSALFTCFLLLGMQAWGGGLTAWMQREVVEKRGWMTDGPFLSGLALAQVAPGANAVNMAVFLGTTLRGAPGAAAALAGLMGVPAALVLLVGGLFLGRSIAVVDTALAGLGAAAIGLTLANGVRLSRGLRDWRQVLVAVVLAGGVGVLRWPLVPALLLAIPGSFALMLLPWPARAP